MAKINQIVKMQKKLQEMSDTIEASNQAAKKMNELTDSMILARNIFVGTLAVYAGYSLLTKFVVSPLLQSYKFISNQTKNLEEALQQKYGKGIVIINNSTTGLGDTYAKYVRMLKFPVIVLVDADAAALAKQKEELLQKRSKDGIEVVVHSIEYDYSRESQEADAMIVSRLNRIVERSGLQISILINNMSTTKDEKRDEKTLLRKAISRV